MPVEKVSPACAGMIPYDAATGILGVGEPRMRGDDPKYNHTKWYALA